MSDYDRTNTGVLFKNEDKTKDTPTWADYQGNINVDGTEYFLNAWIKESKKDGSKFMSLSLKPKTGKQGSPARRGRTDADEDIPF